MTSANYFAMSTLCSNPEGDNAQLHPDQINGTSTSSSTAVIEPMSPLLASPFAFPDGWNTNNIATQPINQSIDQSTADSRPDGHIISKVKIFDGHKGKNASGEIVVEWTRHWSGYMKIPLRVAERTKFRLRITCEPEDPCAWPVNNGLDITPYFSITIDPAKQAGMFPCNADMWNGLVKHSNDSSSTQSSAPASLEFEFEMDNKCNQINLTGEMRRPITSFKDRMNEGSPMILRVEVLHDVLPRVCGEVKFSGWHRAATKKAIKHRTSSDDDVKALSEAAKRVRHGDSC